MVEARRLYEIAVYRPWIYKWLKLTDPPKRFSAGAGGASTAVDYYRFLQMLLNGVELDGVRLLSPQTVKYMLSDHLGMIRGPYYLPGDGYGFGLGFGVRLVGRRVTDDGHRGRGQLGRHHGHGLLARSGSEGRRGVPHPGARHARSLPADAPRHDLWRHDSVTGVSSRLVMPWVRLLRP